MTVETNNTHSRVGDTPSQINSNNIEEFLKETQGVPSDDGIRRPSAPGAVRCLATNRLGEKKLDREIRSSLTTGPPRRTRSKDSDVDEFLNETQGVPSDGTRRPSAPGAVRCLATNRLGEKKLDREIRSSITNERRSSGGTVITHRGLGNSGFGPNQEGQPGVAFKPNQSTPTSSSNYEDHPPETELREQTSQPGAIRSTARRCLGERKTIREQRNSLSPTRAGGDDDSADVMTDQFPPGSNYEEHLPPTELREQTSQPGAIRSTARKCLGERKSVREQRNSLSPTRAGGDDNSADVMTDQFATGNHPPPPPTELREQTSQPGAVRSTARKHLGERKTIREQRNSLSPTRAGGDDDSADVMTDQSPPGSDYEDEPPPTSLLPQISQPGAIRSTARRELGEKKTTREQRNSRSPPRGGRSDGSADVTTGFTDDGKEKSMVHEKGKDGSPYDRTKPTGMGNDETMFNASNHGGTDEQVAAGNGAPVHGRTSTTANWAWATELPPSQVHDASVRRPRGVGNSPIDAMREVMFPSTAGGKHEESESASGKHRTVAILGGVILLLVTIVGILVGVLVTGGGGGGDNNNEQKSDNKEATAAPQYSLDIDPTLIPDIPDSTVVKLLDKNSPQYKAYSWMVEDPIFDQYEDWQITQRFSLATFFYSMGGPRWGDDSTWLDYEVNECEWMDGDNICHEDMAIKLINITKQRGFKGSIPKEVALLTRLEGLDFSNNVLGGDLTGLFDNYFSFDSLRAVRCSECRLSGSVPVEFAQMTALQVVVLNTNDITGELPSEVGQLQELQELELESNKLSGAIPTTIGSIKSLASLILRNNQFNFIPSEIGKLSALEQLDVGNNHIRQSIPTEVGAMEKMRFLELDQNTFHGEVPSELGQMLYLTRLLLNVNELTGSIPEEIYSLSNLQLLWMQKNDLAGSLPSSIGQMTSLTKLDLGLNMLTSTVPSELGHLLEVRELHLYDNKLTGSIPSDIARLPQLVKFELWGNPSIAQQLPGEFCPNPPAQLKTDWCSSTSCCT